jgi:glutamate-1-semialdehyde 2,1-aminomutase
MREKPSSETTAAAAGRESPNRRFSRSRALAERAHELIPGGSHTYAKGDDQFPETVPCIIERGFGCRVVDVDGNEYTEYGMGLRAVTLGHAFPPVVEAARRALDVGTNFTRPARIEIECAERLKALLPWADMVKFCKDGSHANDGAVRLARAYTGRDRIAICGDHPFFSTSDWFIGTTDMPGGIPSWVREHTVKFHYNDLGSLESLFAEFPGEIACVIMEPARLEEPQPGYLESLKQLCHKEGAILVFDEMITGFRWNLGGAPREYGVTPDLATFGKALANGFSLSALVGRRELMELGGIRHPKERVFLLSTTHGAETHALAAGIATMDVYEKQNVIEHLYAKGARLRTGLERLSREAGLSANVGTVSRDCNLLYFTRDADGKPSQPLRTLFIQELLRGGVLAPSFVVSFSHQDSDIDRTLEVTQRALAVYKKALDGGVDGLLEGRPVKPVFRPFA